MRQLIIAGNWKMHKNIHEAMEFLQELRGKLGSTPVEAVVCPPFTALAPVAEALKGSNIALGAQNMHWEKQGAYTGEVSPLMLREIGCKYVILGHSERRQYFGETDESVNKKVKAALEHGLVPIICVGETLDQREAGITEQVVATQTTGALEGLTPGQVAGLVIAYEPVWAIGTGKTASEKDAQQVNRYIRKVIADQYGAAAAEAVRIQYGGSVKPGNARALMSQPDIDGALVGGASLQVDDFVGIIENSL
ncbi:triosephosphate isomerase [Desulfotomaculum nigrificans CO-1-SRB]|uniref:Triosephosphate isomerase n=1 Tax=Desulfotomaculum nigrificans (strain DSM 14880 / VKM B-2319 / CO-1-SRB) TaxID=868595 RepID=F6B4K8_DESCC|nr:triose-phosphate isomerase [Desulfotomaculum nigrificans]AEF93031.1 triosephosphate isomerase [Desulfotomaculum nigrificans CO-1-SRB]